MNPLAQFLRIQLATVGWGLLILLLALFGSLLFLSALWKPARQKVVQLEKSLNTAETTSSSNVMRYLAIFILVVAIAAISVSLLSFEMKKNFLDLIALDQEVESYTTTLDHQLANLVRIVAAALVGLSIWVLWKRDSVSRQLNSGSRRAIALFKRTSLDLQTLLVDFGTIRFDGIFLWALGLITLWGLIMRVYFVDQPVRTDEAHSILRYILQPVSLIIRDYDEPNNHVFHSLLSHASSSVFGIELWALRIPTLAAGVLMIPAGYLVGRMFYGKRAALLGAAMIAGYSILIEFSTNARGYMLMGLMVLLSIGLGEYVRRRPNLAAWFLLILSMSFGIYVLPIMFIPASALIIWLTLSWLTDDARDYGRSFIGYLAFLAVGVAGLTVGLYAPILAGHGLLGTFDSATSYWQYDFDYFFTNLPAVGIDLYEKWSRDLPPYGIIVIAIGLFTFFIFFRKIAKNKIPIALIFLGWTFVVLLLQQAKIRQRIVFFLVPLLLVWAAAGWAYIWERLRLRSARFSDKAYVLIVIAVSLVIGIGVIIQRPDHVFIPNTAGSPEAVGYLKENLRPGDLVLARASEERVLRFYFLIHGVPAEYLYNPLEEPLFERMVVVVEDVPANTVERVLQLRGFPGDVEPENADLLQTFSSTSIFEIIPNDKKQPQEGG